MKYMGSKARHAKELLPIILKDRKPGQWYVEPFVGGANMIDKVDGLRIGNDFHPHLIAMWQAVSEGWLPPRFVSEEDYANARKAAKIDAETGYIGFALSFGGKFFGGYRRDVAGTKGCTDNMETQSRRAYESMLKQAKALTAFVGFGASYSGKWFGGFARGTTSDGVPRNYAAESSDNISKQAEKLNGVIFVNGSYRDLEIPENSIIYCDPPYAGTTKYATGGFDHTTFWQWCRDKVAEGHRVFVSEYTAPDDWECVWEKRVNNTLTKDTGSKQGVERLFTLKKSEHQTDFA